MMVRLGCKKVLMQVRNGKTALIMAILLLLASQANAAGNTVAVTDDGKISLENSAGDQTVSLAPNFMSFGRDGAAYIINGNSGANAKLRIGVDASLPSGSQKVLPLIKMEILVLEIIIQKPN